MMLPVLVVSVSVAFWPRVNLVEDVMVRRPFAARLAVAL